MTRKIVLGGAPLLSLGFGAARSAAWYAARRLRRADGGRAAATMAVARGR